MSRLARSRVSQGQIKGPGWSDPGSARVRSRCPGEGVQGGVEGVYPWGGCSLGVPACTPLPGTLGTPPLHRCTASALPGRDPTSHA